MSKLYPLVLVHGLWDDPRIFNRLSSHLDQFNLTVFSPHLPHKFGSISLVDLAQLLGREIDRRFGSDTQIDLLGFSMGGIIGRVWLQNLGGSLRTRRFFSVGSPHQGTLLSQCAPSWLLSGVSEMKIGSSLLNELNKDITTLNNVDCRSFFCLLDLMVVPSWHSKLPLGLSRPLPAFTHKGLMLNSNSLNILIKEILFQ